MNITICSLNTIGYKARFIEMKQSENSQLVKNQKKKGLTMEMLGQIVKKLVQLSDSFKEALGSLNDFLEKLLGSNGSLWLYEFKKFLRKETCWLKYIIDCDADPFLPQGWEVKRHIQSGRIVWNPSKFKLYLSERQQSGMIPADELQMELENKPVMNANVLDWLLLNKESIPESWEPLVIYFWGTIYQLPHGDLVVRDLYYDKDRGWLGGYSRLVGNFESDRPALLAA